MTSTSVDPATDLDADIDHQSLASASLALARRCSVGATIWCLAPQWPEHARHLAVEFVHPVVVGARALPAVAVSGEDQVAALRLLSRVGDVLIAVGGADEPLVIDAMARSEPWGLTSIWIGAGNRPPIGAADHIVWICDSASTAAYDGRLVLQYHLLWEMTHICFDHPGALIDADPAADDDVCITCSDQGTPAEVESLQPDGLIVVRTRCGPQTVDVSLVGQVVAGDLLLIHAGTAIARLENRVVSAR